MGKRPPFLKKGDQVAIVCPAWKVDNGLEDALQLLRSWGLEVLIGKTVHSSFRQYAGKDAVRAADLQAMLDNPNIKAIFAARGGYGSVRVIDRLDFSRFVDQPKWIVGFSDITLIHSHIQANFGIPTLHAQMPVTIPDATKESLFLLKKALFGEYPSYRYETSSKNLPGKAQGILIGGNLSLLIHVLGSASEADFQDKILFIEDVGEFYYAVDRMLWTLKRAGKLASLKGLIVGGFSNMKDNKVPYGQSIEELVKELVAEYGYPVAFEFPAGHIDDNRPLILGEAICLDVKEEQVDLSYLE